jgi:hypothetical protein
MSIDTYNRRTKKPEGAIILDVSSASGDWGCNLSPFILGPVQLYGDHMSMTVENAWQYTKLFAIHTDEKDEPTEEYWKWAKAGWESKRANRFPMGRGAKPLCSLWDGKQLSYIDARLQIYCPLYYKTVLASPAWTSLKELYKYAKSHDQQLVLVDHDSRPIRRPLIDIAKDDSRPMPHTLILVGMLTDDLFWINKK